MKYLFSISTFLVGFCLLTSGEAQAAAASPGGTVTIRIICEVDGEEVELSLSCNKRIRRNEAGAYYCDENGNKHLDENENGIYCPDIGGK